MILVSGTHGLVLFASFSNHRNVKVFTDGKERLEKVDEHRVNAWSTNGNNVEPDQDDEHLNQVLLFYSG